MLVCSGFERGRMEIKVHGVTLDGDSPLLVNISLDGDSPLLVNITLDVLEVQQSQTRDGGRIRKALCPNMKTGEIMIEGLFYKSGQP